MLIKVTKAQAIAALAAGEILWCPDSGEGWQICDPEGKWDMPLPGKSTWSKNAIRRLVARRYRDARGWTGRDVVEFFVRRGE